MIPQYVAGRSSSVAVIAASRSQGGGLGQVMYVLRRDSAKVAAGRSQSVLTSYGEAAGYGPCASSEEYRSRGCRKAVVSFLPLASLHSQRLARPRQKKSFMWMNPLFRSNRPILASTSDMIGRGMGPLPRPAPSLIALQTGLFQSAVLR
jgi:hypothetical protein